jgi:ATP-dependent DNA helicase RecQ
LGELELADDALVSAQKILSCVIRLHESFGGDYTAQVLTGSRERRIIDNGHDRLSTWGLLTEQGKRNVRAWIEQLSEQGFLEKQGEYHVLHVTPAGRRVLRGEVVPRLLKPARSKQPRDSQTEKVSWKGVDRELFESLRKFRRAKAEERGHPPFVIFSDATLRELSRHRPSDLDQLLKIPGIGQKKCADFGDELLREISDFASRG